MKASEVEIFNLLIKTNGLLNASIAAELSGYALSTCKKILRDFEKKIYIENFCDGGPWFITPRGLREFDKIKGANR